MPLQGWLNQKIKSISGSTAGAQTGYAMHLQTMKNYDIQAVSQSIVFSGLAIAPTGVEGDFDKIDVGIGAIIKTGATYRCVYGGHDGQSESTIRHWRIGLATSTDKINWTRYGMIMDAPSGYWCVYPGDIHYEGGTYYLFAFLKKSGQSVSDVTAWEVWVYTTTDSTLQSGWSSGSVVFTSADFPGSFVLTNPSIIKDGSYYYMTLSEYLYDSTLNGPHIFGIRLFRSASLISGYQPIDATNIINDTFTDTDSTALENHTPDTNTTGNPWTAIARLSGGSTGGGTILSNKLKMTTDGGGYVIDTGKKHGIISVDWTPESGTCRMGIVFQYVSNGTMHYVTFNADGSQIAIEQVNGDSYSTLSSTAYTFTAGQTYSIVVGFKGNSVRVWVGGSIALQHHDIRSTGVNLDGTKHGLMRISGNDNARFDNFNLTRPGLLMPWNYSDTNHPLSLNIFDSKIFKYGNQFAIITGGAGSDVGSRTLQCYFMHYATSIEGAWTTVPDSFYRSATSIEGRTAYIIEDTALDIYGDFFDTDGKLKIWHYNNNRDAIVSLDGLCKDDFADLRFTAADGETLLPYFVASYQSGRWADVYVKTDVPASPNSVDLIIWYNNPNANSASDGATVFPFFDDFPGSSLDTNKWTSQGNVSVGGSELILSQHASLESFIESISGYGAGYAFLSRSRRVDTKDMMNLLLMQTDANNFRGIFYSSGFNSLNIGSGEKFGGAAVNENNEIRVRNDNYYRKFEIKRFPAGTAEYRAENNKLRTSSTAYTNSAKLRVRTWATGSGGAVLKAEWAAVRPCVSPEPTWSRSPQIFNEQISLGIQASMAMSPAGSIYFGSISLVNSAVIDNLANNVIDCDISLSVGTANKIGPWGTIR